MKKGIPINLSSLIRRLPLLALLVLLLAAAASSLAAAQSGGTYRLTWWTVDNGSQPVSTGSDYRLVGGVGQPDAAAPATGSGYQLQSGFWSGERVTQSFSFYLPVVAKGSPTAP